MKTVYIGGKIVSDGKISEGNIICEDGKILEVSENIPADAEMRDLKGDYIAPGFIDIHCHGGNGFEYIDATKEAFEEVNALHYKNGTRYIFPTVSSCDMKTLSSVLDCVKKYKDEAKIKVCGVHIEGPYFSEEMSGAQDPSLIKDPDEKEYLPILEKYSDVIARWSYAPERDKDNKFIKALNSNGVIPAIAHSSAEYEDIVRAYGESLRLVTHLYSCTSSITRHGGFRHLGIIETSYLLDDMLVEAIGDLCHLPKELLKLIIKMKGVENVCLVTDAIRFAGMDKIENVKGGTENVPYVIEDGVAKLSDRSAFAGSIATTGTILKKTVGAGIPLEDTVLMLTKTPARAMHLENAGSIKKGYDAIFTVFNNDLEIKTVL